MCFSQRSLRKSRNRLSLICPATSYNWMWISSHISILYQLYSYTFKLLIVDTQRHSRCLAVLGRSRLVLQLLGLEGTRLQSFEGMFSALWSLLHASDLVPGATVEEILQLIGVLYHYLQGFNHSMGRPLAGTMLFKNLWIPGTFKAPKGGWLYQKKTVLTLTFFVLGEILCWRQWPQSKAIGNVAPYKSLKHVSIWVWDFSFFNFGHTHWMGLSKITQNPKAYHGLS